MKIICYGADVIMEIVGFIVGYLNYFSITIMIVSFRNIVAYSMSTENVNKVSLVQTTHILLALGYFTIHILLTFSYC